MISFVVRYDEHGAGTKLADQLRVLLHEFGGDPSPQRLVVVCIGTDRATGDSLGPFVGTYLMSRGMPNVYGTIDNPVGAHNLPDVLSMIYALHQDPFIIAVDAFLGEHGRVGEIKLELGSVWPGLGVGKNLPPVGNAHIIGCVNAGGGLSPRFAYEMLLTSRLSVVISMARVIAKAIELAVPFEPIATELGRCEVL